MKGYILIYDDFHDDVAGSPHPTSLFKNLNA